MAQRAENEGFRVLDDFVCDAILDPSISPGDPKAPGKNDGLQLTEEIVFDSQGARAAAGGRRRLRPESLGQLRTDEWKRLMELIDRFEQAWTEAVNPADTVDLRAYLPTPTDSLRPAALQELIKTDLEIRWRGDRGVPLEFYLERCPELGPATSLPAALLYEEFRIRQLYGDRPPLDSYAARFPDQFAALKQLVHDQPLPTRSKVAEAPAAPPPAPPPSTPKESEQVGRILSVGGGYELTKYLGGGGFGKVWRAKAPGGVEVAIKLIDRSLEQNEAHRELQALELTKQLRHPFLVQTHSYYALADQIIIDMELCDGSLRDRLRSCRNQGLKGIPPKELLGYFREAAEAFDFLHSQNLQHRDVKPDNILLQQGHAKVADFGLARLQVLEKSIVDSGSGTPPYTAPEVWLGRIKPGSDSDQYSLACTYAELRLDRRLYQGTGMMELMMAHVEGTPDLSPLPQPEQQALLRALAKDPAKRYPSCREFINALEGAMAKYFGQSHMEQTFAEHKNAPASERTGEKTDPNSILPSFGRATLERRSPLLNKWRDSAEEKTSTEERPQPVWRPEKPPDKLAGKPRLFKKFAMFLVLVIAGIALFALIREMIPGAKKRPVDFLPEHAEPAGDAEIITVVGKKYYDHIYLDSPYQAKVEFVLIPPVGNEPAPYYMMADKVSVGLFKKYAENATNLLDSSWNSLPSNKRDDNNPVMGVTAYDAHFFAKSLGGKLPTFRQWDNASGMFNKARGQGPYRDWDPDCAKPWKGKIGVGRTIQDGPLSNQEGTCDEIEVEPYHKKLHDLAGNGREWTSVMFNGQPIDEAIERFKNKKLDATDTVVIRGNSFAEQEPLRYQYYEVCYEKGGANPDSHELIKGDADIGFRVVIEP
jgi:serine/threonine protein kinase